MKRFLLFLLGLCLATRPAAGQMTLAQVQTVIAQAATRAAQISTNSVIAVVDREGYVLGVWSVNPNTNRFTPPGFSGDLANAIGKAGTAAFLSSDEHAFSSRTAGFIVQQNFPPGVQNKPPGPLVGVNFSNLPFTDINRYKNPASYNAGMTNGTNGASVPTPVTGGLAGTPGGVPLYVNNRLVGGVGVAGDSDGPADITPATILGADRDEDVALAGQAGFGPREFLFGSRVTGDGIRFAYTSSTTSLGAVAPLGTIGTNFTFFPLTNSPPVTYPPITIGGVTGELRIPIISDTTSALTPAQRLTATEVTNILAAAANRARTTRAGIRLPRGRPMQVFICVVNNPNLASNAPVVLGSICTSPDTTRFSWDVSVQKARTALFFSSDTRAFSSRTVGFMAQSHYPPGIVGTAPGLFLGLQERFSMFPNNFANPLNGAIYTNAPAINPNLPNGITIFPGGFPLYRNGVLIGAIGVSGDGIDQDDIVSASGAALFPAPAAIRADHSLHRGARLPYAKFPRNPAL